MSAIERVPLWRPRSFEASARGGVSSTDTLPRTTFSAILLNSALKSTENYLLGRAPQRSFGEILLRRWRRRDPVQERQARLRAVSERECETASVHLLSSLLPEIASFPVAALIKSRNAMHEDAPVKWGWHTGVLLSDGEKWHAVSPANYSADPQDNRVISRTNLQDVLDAFSQQEHCDWPSAAFIQDQLHAYKPPHVEPDTTEKGYTLTFLHTPMYVQDGARPRTVAAKLLVGM